MIVASLASDYTRGILILALVVVRTHTSSLLLMCKASNDPL